MSARLAAALLACGLVSAGDLPDPEVYVEVMRPHRYEPNMRTFDCHVCGEGPMHALHHRTTPLDLGTIRASLRRGGPAPDAAGAIIEGLCDLVEGLRLENERLRLQLRLAEDR